MLNRQLPAVPAEVLSSSPTCEFATTTASGLPIDTPLLCQALPGSSTIDVTTGLAYPAKSERARRRPKVGLLFEAPAGGPVVAVAATAAVRDSDLDANALRYARLCAPILADITGGRTWDEVRDAYWYWARVFIECTPRRVVWWDSLASMDRPPQRWDAPEGDVPHSDPAPAGRATPSAPWSAPADWRPRARDVLATLPPPHVATVDAEGYPMVAPVRRARLTDDGFTIDVAGGMPWPVEGPSTLCFSGQATFVGIAHQGRFVVERQLPDLPLVRDPTLIFEPTPDVRAALVNRVHSELHRRRAIPPVLPMAGPEGPAV